MKMTMNDLIFIYICKIKARQKDLWGNKADRLADSVTALKAALVYPKDTHNCQKNDVSVLFLYLQTCYRSC